MANKFNEGHLGATISEIAKFAKASLPDRPNIILLHTGTNHYPPEESYHTGAERLGTLNDELVVACLNAPVLVAQIINAANPKSESRIQNFNDHILSVFAKRAKEGHHIMMVEMRSLTLNDLQDGLHPSNDLYRKMANLWFADIQTADAKKWIKAPVNRTQV